VRTLDTHDTAFFIHIDAKVDEAAFRKAIGDRSNVAFCRERIRIAHSGFSQVRATLALLSAAWNFAGGFERFCLLSGSDFPIKPNDHIRTTFSSAQEFISVGKPRNRPRHDSKLKNTRYYWFMDAPYPARKMLSGWLPHQCTIAADLHYGSSWWALTRECVGYIRAFVRDHDEYPAFFKFSRCPDESFFHSIVKQSPFASRIAMATGQEESGEKRVLGCHYIDWRPWSERGPRILAFEDLEAMRASPALFARKFDEKRSAALLDRLEILLAHRPETGRRQRWRGAPHRWSEREAGESESSVVYSRP
jgi:hypothetical protein